MSKEILLLGEFSTGKSAFINMLLGVSILPERLESTDMPVIKIHGASPAGIWLREPGQKNPLAIDKFSDINKDWSAFKYAEITIPTHPLLKQGLVLWDTPGLNSTNSHHTSHLERFLQNKNSGIKYIYFFLHGNITQTSTNFLKKHNQLKEKLIVVVNIKEIKSENECRAIEQQVKRSTRAHLGSISAELLYIGDIWEEFNEQSEALRKGLSDWELIKEWDKRAINFDELRTKHRDRIIGDYLFDEIIDLSNQQSPDYKEDLEIIEKILNGDDSVDIDNELLYNLANANYSIAQALLGSRLLFGDQLEKDELQGLQLIQMSAEQGNSYGQLILGHCNEIGIGVTQDYKQAVEWYRKSADQGNSYALYKLAFAYFNGNGVKKDLYKSFSLMTKSAELGYSDAQHWVGQCFEYGVGVTQNVSEAFRWYEMAIENGCEKAIESINELNKKYRIK